MKQQIFVGVKKQWIVAISTYRCTNLRMMVEMKKTCPMERLCVLTNLRGVTAVMIAWMNGIGVTVMRGMSVAAIHLHQKTIYQ